MSDRDAAAEGALVEEFLTAGQREAYGRFEGPRLVTGFLTDRPPSAGPMLAWGGGVVGVVLVGPLVLARLDVRADHDLV